MDDLGLDEALAIMHDIGRYEVMAACARYVTEGLLSNTVPNYPVQSGLG